MNLAPRKLTAAHALLIDMLAAGRFSSDLTESRN